MRPIFNVLNVAAALRQPGRFRKGAAHGLLQVLLEPEESFLDRGRRPAGVDRYQPQADAL